MLNIDGNVLITTDWHFGVKQNNILKLKIISDVVKKLKKHIIENNITSLIFAGDMFHQRNNLSIETINVAISSIESLASVCKLYLILGNHDLYNKNSTAIHSMKIFKHIKNVTIIEKSTECSINGNNTLLVPWNTDLTQYKKNSFDMMIGHFDISERYLIASYVEDNIKHNVTNEEMIKQLENDELLKDAGMDDLSFEIENTTEYLVNSQSSSDLLGDWIEIAKEGGTIFSGHIHHHKEFYTKNRKFIFIGSPYQQTRGEENSTDGFYCVDDGNNISFKELNGIPQHKTVKISEIIKDIDNYNFGSIKGNILNLVYDVEIDSVTDSNIHHKLLSNAPYEELQPEYNINVRYEENGEVTEESIEMIRKSKLEYIKNFIDKTDDKIIEKNNLKKEKLFSMATDYYNMVNERN